MPTSDRLRPMLRLHVVPADGQPFEHPLEKDSLTIGRASEADLTLEDRFLSRQHAKLYREGDALLLVDLGSRNGTWLNDVQIEEPTCVGPGDEIRLSGSTLIVTKAGEALAPPDILNTTFLSASDLLTRDLPDAAPQAADGEALRRDAERLKILNEVHQALGRSLALEDLLDLILERVSDHLEPEEASILLKGKDGTIERAASRSSPGLDQYLISDSLIEEVVEKGQGALVVDALIDERFGAASSILASGVRSLVAAPLLDAEGCLGMIALNSRAQVRQFTEEDLDLLVSLASAASLRIRNLSLAEEAAERRRLEAEVALARRHQVALLPDRLPRVEGYEIHGGNVPSRGVSGDYYQVVQRREGRECVFMLADVAGKGIAASLLTACLEALSAGPIQEGLPPAEICSRLCRLLHQRTTPDRFATAFLVVLEPATGALRYVSAGHNPALVVRATGEVDRLRATGLPLGMMPEAKYETRESSLAPGDLLLLYTDGIVEAIDPEEEEYGLDRLVEACLAHRGDRVDEIAAAIERDLETFASGVPFEDDRTLVLARRSLA